MQLLLNTIMLEPNRFTGDHILTSPLVDLLEPVAQAGFNDLEIWQYHISGLTEADLEALVKRLGDLGLHSLALGAYPSLHVEGDEWLVVEADLRRLIDWGAALGVHAFKIFPGSLGSLSVEAATRELSVGRIRELAHALADRGMILTMETHGNTLCDTLDSTLQLLDELSDCGDDIGICFQPYTDDDTDAAIAVFDALRDDIVHIHLQNRRQPEGTTLLELGDWTDYGRFLPHVKAAGFDGLMCLEFTAGMTPVEGESFDVAAVIANASRDRQYVSSIWESA